jgi:hypothetical protein
LNLVPKKEACHGSHNSAHHSSYYSIARRRRLVRPRQVVLISAFARSHQLVGPKSLNGDYLGSRFARGVSERGPFPRSF